MFQKMCLSVLGLFITGSASADWALNTPRGVTVLNPATSDLHAKIMYGCCVIAILVFATMIFALVQHRKSLRTLPESSASSMTAEMIWTCIPIVILFAMVVPSADAVIRYDTTPDEAITSNMIEYQCPRWTGASSVPSVTTATQSSATQQKELPAPVFC